MLLNLTFVTETRSLSRNVLNTATRNEKMLQLLKKKVSHAKEPSLSLNFMRRVKPTWKNEAKCKYSIRVGSLRGPFHTTIRAEMLLADP